MDSFQFSAIRLFFVCVVIAVTAAPIEVSASEHAVTSREAGSTSLEGTWTNATITPLERPVRYGKRLVLTPSEVRALEGDEAWHNTRANGRTDPRIRAEDLPFECGRGFSGANCGYDNFWVDRGTAVLSIGEERRTSIITEPMDGRLPLTIDTRRFAAARAAELEQFADGPEMRTLGERCILSYGSSAGPPMLPLLYNNIYQIVATPERVVIVAEMIHDARIVRINGRHVPDTIRTWMGDSIGTWHGDTLKIETTNFRREADPRGDATNLRVTEFLTRVSPTQIDYKFTVDNPQVYDAVWSGQLAFNKTPQPMHEYACHEGNYALRNILSGARAQDAGREH